MGSDDDDVESLRRALYRAGSGREDVRSYLAVAGPTATRPRPREPLRAARPAGPPPWPLLVGVGALLTAVLCALPAAAGGAPVYRLPSPDAGDFSAPFAVPSASDAASGGLPLWSVLRRGAMFSATTGTALADIAGSDRGYQPLRTAAGAAAGSPTLTIFIACATGVAHLGLATVTEDFDAGYQVPFVAADVPCGGVRCLRYRPPVGITPSAVTVVATSRVAVSVVAGL